jgi:hypothetical protein
MSGNRFNRLPLTNAMEIFQLKNDMNVLASAVEQELLKMSHKIGEEDSISVTDQLAWFMSASS